MNFITRAFGDGTDFIGTKLHRTKDKPAGRSGFGDMICEVSNLYAQATEGNILTDKLHPGFNRFLKMIDHPHDNYLWDVHPGKYARTLQKCKSWEDQKSIPDVTLLHCYPDYDYIKLDRSRFIETELPTGEYATIQRRPYAKKCGYTHQMIQGVERRYPNMNIIEVGDREDLGMEKVAYLIDNAKFHIGIDSGMSHFAHCIKDKQDVHLYVPEDRITGVSYRWINQGYNVTLIKR
jgi:hypothetical protein